jgi:hypothetical protein
MVERSKARVYGRSLAGIAGSNPADSMDVCLCCQVVAWPAFSCFEKEEEEEEEEEEDEKEERLCICNRRAQ